MTEDENEITLQEYLEQIEEAMMEIKSDLSKANANLFFCLETLKEMKEAEWIDQNSEEPKDE